MSVLLWLLIPLAGLLIGAGWVIWRSRPKRTPDAAEGMAEMHRIRQAMNQPMPDLVVPRPEIKVDVQRHDAGIDADATFRKSA